MYSQTLMVNLFFSNFICLNYFLRIQKISPKGRSKMKKSAKTAQKMMGMRGVSEICPNVFEISSRKKKIVERYPIHVGLTVLHLSKLIMLEFITFLYDTLQKDSFEFIYTGLNIQ